ncbi:hypothetical protein A9264_06815 [Vibrio sp. UCD-FRSSP16_10]|uniref:DUF3320 domain-containing protein n=1 Tax=unclassified Vibrio TaxID=2614977 RepID=UPI0007FFD87C|nr:MULTISPECIES: DUF3320 domain-containing protein [unclassified Vibrio]OBT13373.1 hypothetical protein A9264_06815 [Vibrio sp. UCD-FRSSP16_10]OBT17883.1 hypothetical protein A9260_00805 [Vibrio sp. UCD-FRSSP16_30]
MKIKTVFEKSRQELLDMGLRGNTLLSLGKGAKVLDIVDERSSQIFDILVSKNKTMKFLPAPDKLKDDEVPLQLSALTEHLQGQVGEKRHEDAALQTQLFSHSLDTRLLKIHSEAQTYVQEQGVDILYIATGFIKWYEDQSSDKPRYAPLVLIPVTLVRAEAGDAFKLSYTDADLGTNLTLAAKLRMDYAIELPKFGHDEDEFDLTTYFEKVSQAIAKETRWQVVTDKIALSFFSFGKFQMYQDLSDEAWPEGKKPSQHEVIKSLFGGGFESDRTHLDSTPMDVNKAEAIQLVLDSDSSQTEAVLAARSGANLVIQGPPGTGKSQTITNIISQALADNKKVLFVAEKMAALDVVKRRLDNCSIGDSVLELHSNKANKKAVLGSLEEALLQKVPVSPKRGDDIQKLVSLRAQLDDYSAAVNAPIKQTDISYQVALGHSLHTEQVLQDEGIDKSQLPEVISPASNWSNSQYKQVLGIVQELVDYLSAHGAPFVNSYCSTTLSEVSPAVVTRAKSSAEKLVILQQKIIETVQQLACHVSLSMPVDCYLDALKALKSLDVIASKPNLQGIHCDLSNWTQNGDAILQFAKSGLDLQSTKQQLQAEFTEQAFDYDWSATRGVFSTTGKKWWRFLSGDFRKMKAIYAGLRSNGLSGDVDDWLASIDGILQLKSQQREFIESAQAAIKVIGDNFRHERTDWSALFSPMQWLYDTTKSIDEGEIDNGVSDYFDSAQTPISHAQISAINSLVSQYDEVAQTLCTDLQLDEPSFTTQIAKHNVQDLPQVIADMDNVYELVRFNRISESLNQQQLQPWSQLAFTWQEKPALMVIGFQYRYYSQLVSEVYEQQPAIRDFDRVAHEQCIEQFKNIDKQLFNFAQEKLVEDLFERLPNPSARGEVEILRREFNKKRRHLPIRRLINRAGRAIQQIKPVFMMSPMSIATYLDPESIEFDLVVFDEASQVKVADGLGAILRAKQMIVVGDTKQMPPTSFFGRQYSVDDEEAEESMTADIESILGMFLAAGSPERMLRWHYRSRHESLIAVSNQEFYDNKLMIFPSSGINPHATGLNLNYLPHTTYDRGGARVNVGEAGELAKAVIEHAKTSPNQTLGVVAFSTAQRDCILLEVDRLRKENPDLEHFFGAHAEGEDFFVKNLENVQGDERDAIFISIGYGKTPEGRLPMSFGPVNSAGGERRLNVLISRARMSMQVFCNFKAEEMPTTGETPFGVRALKNFLHYADTKELVRPQETGKEPDSPFEEEVISTIRSLGYEVQPQVGCAGFYIDIAVRDPSKPGRYMLAVECDGATYHSSKSARDRDRIRQGVLEGLGWRFHRIWSTDWFRNRHKATERLDDALKSAKAYYANFDETQIVVTEPVKKAVKAEIERVEVEESSSSADYAIADIAELSLTVGQTIPETDLYLLAEDIEKVLKVESPMHSKHLAIRLLSAVGATRSGARINRAIAQAAEYLQQQGKITLDAEYLIYPAKETTVRNRKQLPSNERKFDFVYDDEIALAAKETVQDTFSISKDDLVKSVTEILGFSSTSQSMKRKVEEVLSMQESLGHLNRQGDTFKA